MSFTLRILNISDSAALRALRLQALADSPANFGRESLQATSYFTEKINHPDNIGIFGAFDGTQLIAMMGLQRDSGLKRRHCAKLWGVFTSPNYRAQGISASLLQLLISVAGQQPGLLHVRLSVNARNTAAHQLYLRAGWSEYGRESDALSVNGEMQEEILMTLKLVDNHSL
ncbi:GNAT family N-acetyltransferase [Undibacterium rugosum]|uniref:GNAT family N-acetyltransferase n=1 Tax=Undibacterium rugosum TaxID=2762291 RepID=UPI001B81C675|nr:GNAT family N-acetyltransferase [Undibacterium rugosum]MBR7778489.1 GNAT family N-acetyltransferase [Undibacterium rugosum]